MTPYDTFTSERGGVTFKASLYYDNDEACPWGECDGTGIISEWTSRPKRAGERIIADDGRDRHLYYDWQATMAVAKADKWSAEPHTGTRGERAAHAVESDFRRWKSWLDGAWHYCGVAVRAADDPDDDGFGHALWRIESDSGDYIRDTAEELADEILAERAEVQTAANDAYYVELVELRVDMSMGAAS